MIHPIVPIVPAAIDVEITAPSMHTTRRHTRRAFIAGALTGAALMFATLAACSIYDRVEQAQVATLSRAS